jgi:magnesium-transporting ATPase (P-type)
MRALRDHSLSLVCLAIFLATLVGQSIAGQRVFNEEQLAHGADTISYGRYLHSSHFGQAVMENWQSEWLQFVFFTLATVWLVQRGSNESKPPEEIGRESDQKQLIGGHAKRNSPAWAKARGWRTAIYGNSLVLAMVLIFFGSWLAQSLTAWNVYNEEQTEHEQPTVTWASYVAHADFWEDTPQNWQSEFLAVGTMAVFTIYLRQRGSPESKPVGEAHDVTGTSG